MDQVLPKPFLRKKALAFRKSLSARQVLEASEKIKELCVSKVLLSDIRTVHIYLPIRSSNEVDTRPIVDWLTSQKRDLDIHIPIIRKHKLHSVKLKKDSKLMTAKYGILEPVGEPTVPEEIKFDLIFVPVLAFDGFGHRLGYGKGYYDRFLANQPALKVGLAYAQSQIFPQIPNEIHDIPLDMIITEKGIIYADK